MTKYYSGNAIIDKEILYLAGPIDRKTDEDCHKWRNDVTVALMNYKNIIILNPMRRDYRGLEHSHYRTFVHYDKSDLRKCTMVLAYMPNQCECCKDCYGVSIGTTMEVAISNMLDKYIIVVSPDPRIRNHPWVLDHANYTTITINGAIDHIKDLLERQKWIT
jgi:hypothetical protein